MLNAYMLDKVSHKIKEIRGIEKFDDTKILTDTDGNLPDDITLKNVVILMTCVIKDDGIFTRNISSIKIGEADKMLVKSW